MEFKVNDYITLKLEDNETIMYIGGEKKNFCCGVLVNISGDSSPYFSGNSGSVDYIIDSKKYKSSWRELDIKKQISPEEGFWAFCSNLQVWVENDYNTDLLHYEAAIPILNELVKVGDSLARKVYKKEILRRIKHGTYWTSAFLKYEGYLEKVNLTETELIEGALNLDEAQALLQIAERTEQKYILGTSFDNDEVRERPNFRNLMDPELYFAVDDGHIRELEIELTKEHRKIPEELLCFPNLMILHIWITDKDIRIPRQIFSVHCVVVLKLIMHETVRFPHNIQSFFPNVEKPYGYVSQHSIKPVRKRAGN